MKRFFLVREDILPESLLKTIEAKRLLEGGKVQTIHEAVEKVGLSRSAFYKYKDGIFSLDRFDQEQIVTISMDLEHRSGILSQVLALIAEYSGNVLTINQSIPLQGKANVVISMDTSRMGERLSFFCRIIASARRSQSCEDRRARSCERSAARLIQLGLKR